jgi:hypothetical protein
MWIPVVMVALAGLVATLLTGCGCGDPTADDDTTGDGESYHWEQVAMVGDGATALARVSDLTVAAAGGELYVSLDDGESWEVQATAELPSGPVLLLAGIPGPPRTLVAHVWGKGLYRSQDDGASWAPVAAAPESLLLASFLNPRAVVVPWDAAAATDGVAYLAAPGGLYRSDDQGASWAAVETTSPGSLDLLYTAVDIDGERVAAASQLPDGLVPDEYVDLVAGGVSVSYDAGAAWEEVSGDLPGRAVTGIALGDDGSIAVAALDGGCFEWSGGAWTSLGGPTDAVRISRARGGIDVASGSRGIWRLDAQGWTRAGDGPIVALDGELALAHDGTVLRLVAGAGEPAPEPAGGAVHVALSFHANLYHSYRGDTNDDDGYGQDIRVIRRILDWLDSYPEVHGDWDIENAFSLDGVLPEDAPDIIERIDARVASGRDGLRLMSWNNGAVAAENREEFEASIRWAQDSYLETFGEYDPGVQPQECMFTPEHVGWYGELGVEWITLFNSMTPFTALPGDLTLAGSALYNPLTLRHGVDDELVLVPAYHHGDVLDHGGLAAWVTQIHGQHEGDTLLLIHMDADAVVWENFDRELASLDGLDFVRFTTIQDYLDNHEPVAEVELPGDLADGTGDGFQSWAEKTFNHEIATGIVRARETVARARLLGEGDEGVEAAAVASLEPRLRALSTTHFGLAAPYLCDERIATARARVEDSLAAADAALALAEALAPVDAGQIQLVNPGGGGLALVEIPFELPAEGFDGPAGLALFDADGTELAAVVDVLDDTGDPVRLRATVALTVTGEGSDRLSWRYDPDQPAGAMGDISEGDLDQVPGLAPPFTECAGERTDGQSQGPITPEIDARQVRVLRTDTFDLSLCGGEGQVARTTEVHDGFPGHVVRVSARMGEADDPSWAESVALSPLACEGDADELTWRTHGGAAPTRPVRRGQESWNGQAADGWVALTCDDGDTLAVSHRVLDRTSLAFAPLRNDEGQAILAPLGTLWGDTPWHDARRTGGTGIGDLFTALAGDQMYPAAPDWSGAQIDYTLWIHDELDESTADLFAHPPLVRVGYGD